MDATDYSFAEAAIREARKDRRPHKVGAILVKGTPPPCPELSALLDLVDRDRVVEKNDLLVAGAYGAEIDDKDHAESGLLLERLQGRILRGSTMFVTLEPCKNGQHFVRGGGYKSCAEIIANRGIRRVVVGMLDPDPRIYGRGTKHLEMYAPEGSVERLVVDWFPDELKAACESINEAWIRDRRAKWKYDDRFFAALEATRGVRTRGYPEIAVKDCLTVRKCPNIQGGWSLSEVRVEFQQQRFEIPNEYRGLYDLYFQVLRDDKRFYNDRPKVMLCQNPWAVDDTSTLTLNLRETLYSHVQFYKDIVSATPVRRKEILDKINVAGRMMPERRDQLLLGIEKFAVEHANEPERLIRTLMNSDRRLALFPHAFCFHVIVVTSDDKLLLTRRVPESEYRANTWSCSIEEHMAITDVASTSEGALMRWAQRAMFEELGLTEAHYDAQALRLLAVFLETDILNISLCLHARLSVSREVLDVILSGNPRVDSEMTSWIYLPYDDEELMYEILFGASDRSYHPTARYRLLMALMTKNGERFGR
jgi:pyrimidine deaminase RibD-like protein